jgi:hypothetical protein
MSSLLETGVRTMRIYIVAASHNDFIRIANRIVCKKDDAYAIKEVDINNLDELKGATRCHILLSKNVEVPLTIQHIARHRHDMIVTQELDVI